MFILTRIVNRKSFQKCQQMHPTLPLNCMFSMYVRKPGNLHSTKLLLLSQKETVVAIFSIAGKAKLQETLVSLLVGHISSALSRFIWYAIKNRAKIAARVLYMKA